jgi:ABC-type multidrug transport system ATPase subunit
MSEKILKALMQLFALIGSNSESGRDIKTVEFFLKQQLNKELVEEYLRIYEEYFESFAVNEVGEKLRKKTSVSSVKVIKICRQINEELNQKQKLLALLRLIEFINVDGHLKEVEADFLLAVSSEFNIPENEYANCLSFVLNDEQNNPIEPSELLILNNNSNNSFYNSDQEQLFETSKESLSILRLKSIGLFIFKCKGSSELYLNGQLIDIKRIHIFSQGASLRSKKFRPLYYSEIASYFVSSHNNQQLTFEVKNVNYRFKNRKKGLRGISFSEEGGKMVAIMGGSGAGKSTLLNVLNGSNKPSEGEVLINGFNLHKEKNKLEGFIGYISQDDLLIEELSVYQNLFYNTKLCFADYSDKQISELVINLLKDLGLFEIRDLKIGTPLQNTISGGQRKRLNIALELIREPSVLFVDEPTSGLSSRDSENVMDLLKELSLKGKLVFVVIHQPSSEIFKMFDKLLILDLGGYPIYYGNPVESLVYFKSSVNQINASNAECKTCGNVNPEQVFNIIETKVLDEDGSPTLKRKYAPKEWNDIFLKSESQKQTKLVNPDKNVFSKFKKPGFIKQLNVFLMRDLLSKITNKQYLIINLLEAPALAFILAFLTKFSYSQNEYIFSANRNFIGYIFMCVVVSLFIGLTVSAEEIIKDRKILKRESYLNLSKGSYLLSKIILLFFISAIQSFSFVLIGNYLLEIKGMYTDYWLVLFTTSCFANMLGLNISASFNSVVTIYILIPILLIPQLILSGVIVKFDELNPVLSSRSRVPLTGDLMASRWAFEAIVVNQFVNNDYQKIEYNYNKIMHNAEFRKTAWYNKMNDTIGELEQQIISKKQINPDATILLTNEIEKSQLETGLRFRYYEDLKKGILNLEIIKEIHAYLDLIKTYYIDIFNSQEIKRDNAVSKFQSSAEGIKLYDELQKTSFNEKLEQYVNEKDPLAESIYFENNRIYSNVKPIYRDAEYDSFIRAHLFSPTKRVFGKLYQTYWVNICVIWVMSLILAITLYFDVLKKIIDSSEIFTRRFSKD